MNMDTEKITDQNQKTKPSIIINGKLNNEDHGVKNCEVVNIFKIVNGNNFSSLNLSNSFIMKFPSELSNFQFITELDLSNNELDTFPEEFILFKKLRVINIKKNLFKEFPSAFYNGLHLLKTINASNNRITSINKPFYCLPKLQHFDLSSNALVEPPMWLTDDIPSSLEYLDMSNNPCFGRYAQLKKSSSRGKLKVADTIKVLKISNCQFCDSNGSSYLVNFRNLLSLYIGNNSEKQNYFNYLNNMKSLPINIEQLIMNNVCLHNVPSCITDLGKLRYLDISCNMIQWLPTSIENLKLLVILHAEECNLCILPHEISELTSLKELYISLNQLVSIEGLEKLTNIEVIDLYGNQLITVPDFSKFSRLNAVDLCQNCADPPSFIEVNDVTYHYEELKNCLRSKILCCNRKNGAKMVLAISEDESFEDTDFSLDNEREDMGSKSSSVASYQISDIIQQDVWEVDENETFDPNVWSHENLHSIKRNRSCESLTGDTPYEVTSHPHYFTPFQLVLPVDVCENSLPAPVEGQFDDF